MKMEYYDDTITAISTAFGEGAVGIVRLSGKDAVSVADKIFLSKSGIKPSDFKTYTMHYGWIVQGSDNIVDEVLLAVMRAPKSYTREDVVEINSHGGVRALSRILELVLEHGARLAEPGEFTKRAFLNGRLDLTQAEAVLDIIRAKSDLALKTSLAQLSGKLSEKISLLRDSLLETLALIEAQIDFTEEDVASSERPEFQTKILSCTLDIKSLLEKSFQGRIIRDGLKVVIYGRPNVGKSSLLNAILKQERAIVTSIAGTTRDTIEEFINIKGLAVRLIDTAGILEYRDEIEKEAIARTKKALDECDLVIFVLDGSLCLTEEDRILAKQASNKKAIVVVNKCDLPRKINKQEVESLFSKSMLEVSASQGTNIVGLEELIYKSIFDNVAISPESGLVSNVRHIEILKKSVSLLELSLDSLNKGLSYEFVALDLKKVLDILGELTGEVVGVDILDVIFSKFCVGK